MVYSTKETIGSIPIQGKLVNATSNQLSTSYKHTHTQKSHIKTDCFNQRSIVYKAKLLHL